MFNKANAIKEVKNNYSKVVVIMGGTNDERDVSLNSGKNVLDTITGMGINAVGFDYVGRESLQNLLSLSPDFVFIMLHGGVGENGIIQAWCEMNCIPYSGNDTQACCIGMNKTYSKSIWNFIGLNVAKSCVYNSDYSESFHFDMEFPLVIKPNSGGSSVGLYIANNSEEAINFIKESFLKYDEEVLVEEYIQGDEYTVSMIAGEILPPICIKTEKGIYDYEAKYSSSKTEYIFDSLNSDDENTIKELTRKSLLAIGVKRFGRVDFIFKENKFYILEANLIPGMTKSSLLPKAGNKVGYDYETIVLKIIDKEGR